MIRSHEAYDPWRSTDETVSAEEDPWVENLGQLQNSVPPVPRFSFPLEFRVHPLVEGLASVPLCLLRRLARVFDDGPCCSLPFLVTDRQHIIYYDQGNGIKLFRMGVRNRSILYRFYVLRVALLHEANVKHDQGLHLKYGSPFFTLQKSDEPGAAVQVGLHQIIEVPTEQLAREVEPPRLLRLGSRRLFSRSHAESLGLHRSMPEAQIAYAGAVKEDRSPLFNYVELANMWGESFASQKEKNMLNLVRTSLDAKHDLDQFSSQIVLTEHDCPQRQSREDMEDALDALLQMPLVKTGFDPEPLQLAEVLADPRALELLINDSRRVGLH